MKVAKFIKEFPSTTANQAVYECNPPIENHKYVVASAIHNAQVHETLLFSGDPDGKIVNYVEVGGVKNTTSHAKAFARIGYTIKGQP